jgi:hypothetical protein
MSAGGFTMVARVASTASGLKLAGRSPSFTVEEEPSRPLLSFSEPAVFVSMKRHGLAAGGAARK